MLDQLKKALRNEDGQAIVELALVLPILLLVLFGVFDFGSAVNDWNNTTSLANLGARYAAVGTLPNTTADPTCGSNTTIQTYVQCEANHTYHMSTGTSAFGFQGPVQVVVCTPAGASGTSTGDPITVQVSGSYSPIPVSKLLGRGFASLPISGSATMRLENNFPSTLSSTAIASC